MKYSRIIIVIINPLLKTKIYSSTNQEGLSQVCNRRCKFTKPDHVDTLADGELKRDKDGIRLIMLQNFLIILSGNFLLIYYAQNYS